MVMKKKGSSLSVVFIKYLISIGISLTIAIVLILTLFALAANAGLYIPADETENILLRSKESIAEAEPFDSSLLPSNCTYTLLGTDGTLIQSNMTEDEQQNVLIYRQNDYKNVPSYLGAYMSIARADGDCVVHYYVLPHYKSAWMNAHFPRINTVLMTLIVLICVFCCMSVTLCWSRYLARELRPMLDAAEKIAGQDLDFEVTSSEIKEFNTVLQGITDMKNALKKALRSQWESEKNRNEQISALAHDIKTPIAIVKGNAELLGESGLKDKQMEYVGYIQKNSERIERYTKALIEINKTERVSDAHFRDMFGAEFIGRLKEASAEIDNVMHRQLLFTEKDIPETMHIDPDLIERAYLNILMNALEYDQSEEPIQIEVEGCGKEFQIWVTDHGNGFSKEGLADAARQFYREDASRHSSDHYGIGLYVTDRIMQIHKGRLLMENDPDTHGAKVTLQFPVI